ncbi:uncharacterized protein [Rutidosis leptorrhynchoides]|uniref:uncharacterized protein n=1 Tax=Rutidosis leptorrhynchoides TaxID=125765 RepID=UPI003A995981
MNCKPPSFNGNEEAVELTRWFEKVESIFRICNCAEADKVKYATHTLGGLALTWWNAYAQIVGLDDANAIPWAVIGTNIEAYTNRFIELGSLCPDMVPTEQKKIERYIEGLPDEIQGNVIAASKETLNAMILMSQNLMMAKKRKAAANKQAEAKHHNGKCMAYCTKCKKTGHIAKYCKVPATKANAFVPTCYDCGEVGHFHNQCPKNKGNNGNTKSRAFVITAEEAREDDEVITA